MLANVYYATFYTLIKEQASNAYYQGEKLKIILKIFSYINVLTLSYLMWKKKSHHIGERP